jgi:L-fucose mutarotase/ribose pyranase (RbsD/FucU family)
MLKGLDPLLGADLLHALRSMGHGDELVIVDANFPAASSGPRLVRLDGISATRALEAVLSVMPLDDFVDQACARMEVVGDPDAVPEVCKEFQEIIERAEGSRFKLARSSASRSTSARAAPSPWSRPVKPGSTATCCSRWASSGRPELAAGALGTLPPIDSKDSEIQVTLRHERSTGR